MAGGGSTDTYNEAKLRVAVIDAGGANLGSVRYALTIPTTCLARIA
jgi:hypothetical protein